MTTMEENRNDGGELGDAASGPGFPRVPSEADRTSCASPIRIANNN